MSEHWIQTYDGRAFDVVNPDPADIDPNTLAVGLSRMCRFGCHSRVFYSVAQHSVLVTEFAERDGIKQPGLLLAFLLHDAHELYWGFGDIPRPAFRSLPTSIRVVLSNRRERVDVAIAERFGFPHTLFKDDLIKHADSVLLATEKRDVMAPEPKPWAPLPDPLQEPIVEWYPWEASVRFETKLKYLLAANREDACQNH